MPQWYDLSDKDQRPIPDLSRHPLNRNHRFFDSKGPGGALTPRPASASEPRSQGGKQLEIDKTDIVQYAHNGYTYCMLLFGTPEAAIFDDEVLISGGGDGTIKIWALNAEDGGSISELRVLESGDDSVLTLTIDTTFLYSGRSGGDVNVWDLETCQLVRRIESYRVDVLTLCVGHGSIFSGSADGLVKVRMHLHRSLMRVIDYHSNLAPVTSACMNGRPTISSSSLPSSPSNKEN